MKLLIEPMKGRDGFLRLIAVPRAQQGDEAVVVRPRWPGMVAGAGIAHDGTAASGHSRDNRKIHRTIV